MVFKGPDDLLSQSSSFYEQRGPAWSQCFMVNWQEFVNFMSWKLRLRLCFSQWFESGWDSVGKRWCHSVVICTPIKIQIWWQFVGCLLMLPGRCQSNVTHAHPHPQWSKLADCSTLKWYSRMPLIVVHFVIIINLFRAQLCSKHTKKYCNSGFLL